MSKANTAVASVTQQSGQIVPVSDRVQKRLKTDDMNVNTISLAKSISHLLTFKNTMFSRCLSVSLVYFWAVDQARVEVVTWSRDLVVRYGRFVTNDSLRYARAA